MSGKESEEQKRERHYGSVLKWNHLQEAIAWAHSNLPPGNRCDTPAAAKKKEAKLLEYFERNSRR
jgi:hypothetical protein